MNLNTYYQSKLLSKLLLYKFSLRLPTFHDFQVNPNILQPLHKKQIYTPSSIQYKAIPKILQQKQHSFQISAQTGTGKTYCFYLPLFHHLKTFEQKSESILSQPFKPKGLIIQPTRQLCVQVTSVGKQISHYCRLKVLGIGIGRAKKIQQKSLTSGCDILVSTISRLAKLQKILKLSQLQYLIFDQIDTLLDAGNYEQIKKLVQFQQKRQMYALKNDFFVPKILFVSATYSPIVKKFHDQVFKKRKLNQEMQLCQVIDKNTHMNLQNIKHQFRHAQRDKLDPLLELLKEEKGKLQKEEGSVIIFCNTISCAQKVQYFLSENNIKASILHGDVPKKIRQKNYISFNQQKRKILISTDIAARGLDFKFVTHIINFDFPQTLSDYLHRAGRTGRAVSFKLLGNKRNCVFFLQQKASSFNQLVESFEKIRYPFNYQQFCIFIKKQGNNQKVDERRRKKLIQGIQEEEDYQKNGYIAKQKEIWLENEEEPLNEIKEKENGNDQREKQQKEQMRFQEQFTLILMNTKNQGRKSGSSLFRQYRSPEPSTFFRNIHISSHINYKKI